MKSTILGSAFYNSRCGCIGLVLFNNGVMDKAYVGTGQGIDEEADIKFILEFGAPFPVEAARLALGILQKT